MCKSDASTEYITTNHNLFFPTTNMEHKSPARLGGDNPASRETWLTNNDMNLCALIICIYIYISDARANTSANMYVYYDYIAAVL